MNLDKLEMVSLDMMLFKNGENEIVFESALTRKAMATISIIAFINL